jgi:hypothetical protein
MDVAAAGVMLVKGRSTTALCLSVISFLFTPAIAKLDSSNPPVRQSIKVEAAASTCDRDAIQSETFEVEKVGGCHEERKAKNE